MCDWESSMPECEIDRLTQENNRLCSENNRLKETLTSYQKSRQTLIVERDALKKEVTQLKAKWYGTSYGQTALQQMTAKKSCKHFNKCYNCGRCLGCMTKRFTPIPCSVCGGGY